MGPMDLYKRLIHFYSCFYYVTVIVIVAWRERESNNIAVTTMILSDDYSLVMGLSLYILHFRNSYHFPARLLVVFIFLLYRCGNWGPAKLRALPQITQTCSYIINKHTNAINLYDMTEAIKGQSTVEIKTAELLLLGTTRGKGNRGWDCRVCLGDKHFLIWSHILITC